MAAKPKQPKQRFFIFSFMFQGGDSNSQKTASHLISGHGVTLVTAMYQVAELHQARSITPLMWKEVTAADARIHQSLEANTGKRKKEFEDLRKASEGY